MLVDFHRTTWNYNYIILYLKQYYTVQVQALKSSLTHKNTSLHIITVKASNQIKKYLKITVSCEMTLYSQHTVSNLSSQ
jgi:hypothetical protein